MTAEQYHLFLGRGSPRWGERLRSLSVAYTHLGRAVKPGRSFWCWGKPPKSNVITMSVGFYQFLSAVLQFFSITFSLGINQTHLTHKPIHLSLLPDSPPPVPWECAWLSAGPLVQRQLPKISKTYCTLECLRKKLWSDGDTINRV